MRYLAKNTKFLDIACGTGDALAVAASCSPEAELWGLDIDLPSLEVCGQRVPRAILRQGDMHSPNCLPPGAFDVVHEFGAACMARGWDLLAKSYFSLLRDGGVLIWELPQRWSAAHISYLLTLAPRADENESKVRRILRSFSPSKYRFESDRSLLRALKATGCNYEVIEKVHIWYFYWGKPISSLLNVFARAFGDAVFEFIDGVTGLIWPRQAGYYLVLRKNPNPPTGRM
jgi:ubiquinone/menaquinone biosynthesis C-methylase UbiE